MVAPEQLVSWTLERLADEARAAPETFLARTGMHVAAFWRMYARATSLAQPLRSCIDYEADSRPLFLAEYLPDAATPAARKRERRTTRRS